MSTWGMEAWENDAAADWCLELFSRCALVEVIDEALALAPDENGEEIRAAAFVLRQLGFRYVWPIEHLDRQIALAAEALGRVIESVDQAEGTGGNLSGAVRREREELLARL